MQHSQISKTSFALADIKWNGTQENQRFTQNKSKRERESDITSKFCSWEVQLLIDMKWKQK